MQSLRLSLAGFLLALWPIAVVAEEPPNWVPEEHRQHFVRFVDDRSAWDKALNSVDVELGETGRAFALIAGVSFYPNMKGKERDLTPARVDLEKLASYLSAEPESFNEIVVLAEEDMTAEKLRYFLTQYFPKRLADAPRSRFLFAYSGHGMTAEWGEGFLLTNDAENLSDRFNSVSLRELRVWFGHVVREGHQVLALINACFGSSFHDLSVAFGEDGEDDKPTIPQWEGAHAITAGRDGELTWHSEAFGEGSIFFEALLLALDGRADRYRDGVVTIDELTTYLRRTIRSYSGGRQTPRPGDLFKGGSPGGFYFLDRKRLVDKEIVAKLEGRWWQPFGAKNQKQTTEKKQLSNLNRNSTAGKLLTSPTTTAPRNTFPPPDTVGPPRTQFLYSNFQRDLLAIIKHAESDFKSITGNRMTPRDAAGFYYELKDSVFDCDDEYIVETKQQFEYHCEYMSEIEHNSYYGNAILDIQLALPNWKILESDTCKIVDNLDCTYLWNPENSLYLLFYKSKNEILYSTQIYIGRSKKII